MTRYKVTQISSLYGQITSRTYRWKWQARFIAWIFAGDSITGLAQLTTRIEEVE